MGNKPSLKIGLDAILELGSHKTPAKKTLNQQQILQIPIELIIENPYQPRQTFSEEALLELADSIKAQGIIQPVVVREFKEKYQLITGERRLRAARIAGLNEIPVIVNNASDDVVAAFSLVENLQREDLNSIEEAIALEKLYREFNLTHEEIARRIGKSRTAITNKLRLLELPHYVKQLMLNNEIDMGHGRALLPLDEVVQVKIANSIVEKKLSVRQTEKLVQEFLNLKPIKSEIPENIIQQAKDWQYQLSQNLSSNVKIKMKDQEAGKIEISFDNFEQASYYVKHLKLV